MKLPSQIKISDHLGKEFTFDTLEAFEDFIKGQADFWSQRQSIANQSAFARSYIERHNGFLTVINQINSWRPQLETWDDSTFNSNFTSIIKGYVGTSWLWNHHPFIEKWLELTEVSINTADAFFEAIVQKTTGRFANGIDFFQGYVIAYEYVNQDNTNINKRRKSEKNSLDKLRTELATKQTELISEVSVFKSGINEWKETTKEELADLLVNKEKCLDETNEFHSKSFHEQYAKWADKIVELENTYREKLRFESPASYWKTRAKECKEEGDKWAGWLVTLIFIAIAVFGSLMFAWLNRFNTGVNFNNLEGVVIIAIALSLFVFALRTLAKLTFSSYHLQRDAEEREQLTHLYLALANDSKVDAESRNIVLQALFSRSESGLLSGESGPTLPVQDIVGLIKNQRPN